MKIGFLSEKTENVISTPRASVKKEYAPPRCEARRSLVEVYFPSRNLTCSYYNDLFDLKRGDVVFVEGKLEGMRGIVKSVNYSFKIKLSEYKRVIAKSDLEVRGEAFILPSYFFSAEERTLPYEKVRGWFLPPKSEEEEYASGEEGEFTISLDELGKIKAPSYVFERGVDYFENGRVLFLEINGERVRAIVQGSKPYEVEFSLRGREVTLPLCDCFCAGLCKHSFATLLALKRAIDEFDEGYGIFSEMEYLALMDKDVFIENVLYKKNKGSVKIDDGI